MIKNIYLHSLGRSSMHICSKIGGNVLWKWTIKHSQHACNTCKKKNERDTPPFHVTLNHLWFIVNTHARRAADLYWKGSQRCKNSRNFVACHLRIFNINHFYRASKYTNFRTVTSSDKHPLYKVFRFHSHKPSSLHNNPNCIDMIDTPNAKQKEMHSKTGNRTITMLPTSWRYFDQDVYDFSVYRSRYKFLSSIF